MHTHCCNVRIPSSHVRNTPQPCCQSTKLRSMISYVKTKIVVKFEASEMMCVELRAKKLRIVYMHIIVHMKTPFSHVRNTPKPCRQVHET